MRQNYKVGCRLKVHSKCTPSVSSPGSSSLYYQMRILGKIDNGKNAPNFTLSSEYRPKFTRNLQSECKRSVHVRLIHRFINKVYQKSKINLAISRIMIHANFSILRNCILTQGVTDHYTADGHFFDQSQQQKNISK